MPRKAAYNWTAIGEYYAAGHTIAECQARFGFSNGAWHRARERGDLSVPIRGGGTKPRGETAGLVAELLEQGYAQSEIAHLLGVSRPTVCFHVRRLGIPARTELVNRFDWDEIRAYYDAGNSMTKCRARFGFSRAAWYHAIQRGVISPRPREEPIEGILASGRRRNRLHVKGRLLSAGLKEERCERCGLTEWRGARLGLQLHHVNGDGHDNRLENLELLCPNCHSQTESWGGRNKALRAAAARAAEQP